MDRRELYLVVHRISGKKVIGVCFIVYSKLRVPQKVWLVFVAVIYFSSYSDVKIGSDDSKPEYNNATWSVQISVYPDTRYQ